MGLQLLYVALGDEDRIAIYERGPAGALTLRGHAACAGGPMWLCANPGLTHVHACTVNTSELVSFRVDEATGALVELHRLAYPALSPLDPHGQPWTGPGVPCHMSMDQTGRYIFTAFYTAGIVTVHGVDKAEGGGGSGGGGGHAVGPAVQVLATSHGCHSAQVEPRGNADVYVPCVAAWAGVGADPNNSILAGNMLHHYRFDAGTGLLSEAGPPLIPPPTGRTQSPRFGAPHQQGTAPLNRVGCRPELGPRHVAFHPHGPSLLTSDEQGNSVSAYFIGADGALAPLGAPVSTLPVDWPPPDARRDAPDWSPHTAEEPALTSATSEIRVHPSGALVFCPNRGHNSVATIACDPAGGGVRGPAALAPTRHVPQAIELDPAGRTLYAAGGVPGSATDRLTVFPNSYHYM
jgi:6-phosphogluconolactonase (cycloisomerase 2 family)